MAKASRKGSEVLKRVREVLPVRLTDSELLERGQRLANVSRDLGLLEAEQEEVKATWKKRNAELEHLGSGLAHAIRTRAEPRPVTCEVRADYDEGTVAVIRTDTGEVVQERKLLPEERQGQLISMPESDEGEDEGGGGQETGTH